MSKIEGHKQRLIIKSCYDGYIDNNRILNRLILFFTFTQKIYFIFI